MLLDWNISSYRTTSALFLRKNNAFFEKILMNFIYLFKLCKNMKTSFRYMHRNLPRLWGIFIFKPATYNIIGRDSFSRAIVHSLLVSWFIHRRNGKSMENISYWCYLLTSLAKKANVETRCSFHDECSADFKIRAHRECLPET